MSSRAPEWSGTPWDDDEVTGIHRAIGLLRRPFTPPLDDRLLLRCVDALAGSGAIETPVVLVIDDDEMHGETLRRWLGRRGFAVVVNRSHSDGIREAIAGQWDAVLLDGADVTRITDARPDLASRVLLVTASDVEGALVKPFSPRDLLDWLRQTVD